VADDVQFAPQRDDVPLFAVPFRPGLLAPWANTYLRIEVYFLTLRMIARFFHDW
jgi:hypothetical protein